MEWISYLQITTSNKTTNFSDSLWPPFPCYSWQLIYCMLSYSLPHTKEPNIEQISKERQVCLLWPEWTHHVPSGCVTSWEDMPVALLCLGDTLWPLGKCNSIIVKPKHTQQMLPPVWYDKKSHAMPSRVTCDHTTFGTLNGAKPKCSKKVYAVIEVVLCY